MVSTSLSLAFVLYAPDCSYVEYELTIIVLDVVLYKPQAYRHLLFNRLPGVACTYAMDTLDRL